MDSFMSVIYKSLDDEYTSKMLALSIIKIKQCLNVC